MEVQSNLISESASTRYARVWADYSASVQRGEVTTLSSYCRLTHTSYEGIRHWIRSRGMSVKSLKKSRCSPETALITGVAETKSVSFIQFAPSAPAAPSASMRGVSIIFPDGVNLSLQQALAEKY